MNALCRISMLLAAAVLSACSTGSIRDYERCITGLSALGGVAGAASSGAGVIVGTAAGALAGGVICYSGADDTPAPAPVTPTVVRESDADSDGVPDAEDRCPNTPAGVAVDDRGCPLPEEVLLTVDRLNFEFDSAELDATSRAALDAAVAVISSHSAVTLDVVGYTDSTGPESYNLGLSMRRAQAAVDYLVSRGIPASQLTARGRGELDPVASNATRDGRAQNRRVELIVR